MFEGKGVLVHRLAFRLTYGHWPTPVGRHSCGTPLCFNPRHVIERARTHAGKGLAGERGRRC
ncbi:MAG: hypothetical protein WB755_13210 [Terriglobales bacterium]